MDLIDKIKEIAARIPNQMEHIKTEEATKNAFIMPFISALGYDVFNPTEVIPEFIADIGEKKNEKVDYVIKKDNEFILLIECKWCGVKLSRDHALQLERYFPTTDAKFGILTNGIQYQFYTDIDAQNKMDKKPFFYFDILDFKDHHIEELKKFTKSAFSLEEIKDTASNLKYTNEIKRILEDELNNPSEEFVRFFAAKICDKRITKQVLDQFTEIVKEARKQFINEKIDQRLKSALAVGNENKLDENETDEVEKDQEDNGIVTTEDEIEGYHIVKAILRDTLDVRRVVMRDTKSYCGVLLDDNNRKPICRLRFNSSQKYIGIFCRKEEEKIPIDDVNDIFQYAEKIKSTVAEYE
jgi:hypothetical protein